MSNMRHLAPILLALTIAIPASAADPIVYSYGDEIDAGQRAAVEIALYRWERATGLHLAQPYTAGNGSISLLVDAADLIDWWHDDRDGLEDVWSVAGPDDGTPLEYVQTVADADLVIMLIDVSLSRVEAIGPALHGWGHVFGLDDARGPCAHLSVMSPHSVGHAWPTRDAVAAVRERWGP